MPPKLNVTRATQYAQVDPTFTARLKEIWKERWKALNEEIKCQPPQYRTMKAKNNAPIMSRLKGLCTNQDLLDKEITRLRGLPYERFYVRQYKGRQWLVGLTRPVVMNDDVRLYQAPRYFVYIPENVVARGTDADFHFVPEGNELTTARHPHHKTRDYYYDENGISQPLGAGGVKDPLDYVPSTCWGSFGVIANSCITAGDMVDLFRNIGIYLTRVNQNSLLVRPFNACFFLRDIGPAEAPAPATITKRTQFTTANGRVR